MYCELCPLLWLPVPALCTQNSKCDLKYYINIIQYCSTVHYLLKLSQINYFETIFKYLKLIAKHQHIRNVKGTQLLDHNSPTFQGCAVRVFLFYLQSCNVHNCGYDVGDCGVNNYRDLYEIKIYRNSTYYKVPPGESIINMCECKWILNI